MVDIFIPSYHRPTRIKTAKYLINLGYDPKKIHVFVDSETDDIEAYETNTKSLGCNLYVFDMDEARARYDYVHRPSPSRRSAGQARNMFYDKAKELGIECYCVIDDDTSCYQLRPFSIYTRTATINDIDSVFTAIIDFITRQKIGMFGLSQTGDLFARYDEHIFRKKVMNTTFINTKYMYRAERGLQDDDTSQFVSVMNAGLFTGSLATGLILDQTASATAKGGLTDLYNEAKLLNKALTVPIQFPSLAVANSQPMNGGRIHHKINYQNLFPKILKGKRNNIAWDTYLEDIPFTLEPRRTELVKENING